MSRKKKKNDKVWVFGVVVKPPPGTPASHIKVPGFESWLLYPFQLPANVHHSRQQVMTLLLGFLHPVW